MKKQKSKKDSLTPKLSIIILSYNTADLLADCLNSLNQVRSELDFEVVVVDNGSTDRSVDIVKEKYPWAKLIISKTNLGFAGGNNLARKQVKGEYVLFLNSDTVVNEGTLSELLEYMESNPKVGAVTSKLVLPDGHLDKDVRRSFPTPWVAFTHLVLPLDRIFPTSSLFARYWYSFIPEDEIHEVDVLQGAFFLTRKSILDQVDWFTEDYFLDGEDIDLSWKIKDKGFQLIYYPKVETVHVKGASKGKDKNKTRVMKKEKLKYRLAGVNSMEIFYKKRMWDKYPLFVNYSVLLGLKILKLIRIVKINIFG